MSFGKNLPFIIILMFCVSSLHAAGVIQGSVSDSQTGEPLSGAQIQITGTLWGTVSDESGGFNLDNIPAGRYDIEISFLGYFPESRAVIITNGGSVNIHAELKSYFIELPQVTVEGQGINVKLYTKNDIIRSGAGNLSNFLMQSGDIQILDRGGASESKIIIRGANSNQVSVYLDGFRLNDPRTGEVDLKNVPLSNVEKIIVNPNSDLSKGSSSLGGAVEIYTSGNSEKSLSCGTGSYGYKQYTMNFGDAYGKHSLFISLNRSESEGNFIYTASDEIEKERINDDYDSHNLFMKYSYKTGSNIFDAGYHHQASERGSPGGIENPFLKDRIIRRLDGINMNFKKIIDKNAADLAFRYFETDTDNESYIFFGGIYNYNPSRHRSQVWEIKSDLIRSDRMGSETLGIFARRDRVTSTAYEQTEIRDDIAFYAQRKLKYRNLHLSTIVRSDFYSDAGNIVSSAASLRYSPFLIKGISVYTDYSRDFNLPTFNQLFWAENVFSAPNPDLQPERGETYDFGLEWKGSGIYAKSVYFVRRIEDIIIWRQSYTSAGRRQWKPFNSDLALIKGLELFMQYEGKPVTLSASATLSDPRNKGKTYYNNYLTFKPQIQTSEFVTFTILSNLSFTINHRYMSKRYILETNTKYEPAVSLFDASAAHEFSVDNYEFKTVFRIENITDKSYSIISDYPMPGRNYNLMLILNLPN
ncbi:TonB-dependent receptor [bacterium]|nr:TonB-dependent receptor [bacterium]